MRTRDIVAAALALAGAASVAARADYLIPVPGSGLTALVMAFNCVIGGVTKQCPSHVLIDSAGVEKGTPTNPVVTVGLPHQYTPVPGFQVIASPSTATGLTVPGGATVAEICVETQGVRYRDDGPSPTGSVGIPVVPISASQPFCFQYAGALAAIKFIQQSPGASIDVSYYK